MYIKCVEVGLDSTQFCTITDYTFTMFLQRQLTATLYCEITLKVIKLVRLPPVGLRRVAHIPKHIFKESGEYAHALDAACETTWFEYPDWRVKCYDYRGTLYVGYMHLTDDGSTSW